MFFWENIIYKIFNVWKNLAAEMMMELGVDALMP